MSNKVVYDHIVALDLEMNQPSGNIIQIGLAIGQLSTKQVVDSYSIFVSLPSNEILNDEIIKLTGISKEDMKSSISLPLAYLDMCNFLKKYVHRKQVVTWGGGDQYELNKQLTQYYSNFDKSFAESQKNGLIPECPFGYTCMNVKNIHQFIQEAKGLSIQGGLAKSLTKYKLQFVGSKHNAKDDAINTLRLYFYLLDNMQGF